MSWQVRNGSHTIHRSPPLYPTVWCICVHWYIYMFILIYKYYHNTAITTEATFDAANVSTPIHCYYYSPAITIVCQYLHHWQLLIVLLWVWWKWEILCLERESNPRPLAFWGSVLTISPPWLLNVTILPMSACLCGSLRHCVQKTKLVPLELKVV